MIKILLVVLAGAALVAHGCSSDSAVPAVADAPKASSSTSVLDNPVLDMAASVAGVQVAPMTDEAGCSASALPPQKVEALVESLPPAQQVVLAKLLNGSSTVWSAQLYSGSQGAGLCLPGRNEVVLFPDGAGQALAALQQGASTLLKASH